MNEEGMMFRMNEDGEFEEYKEPYCVIECPEKEDYDHIVEMVEKGEKMRWIPVTERLPDEGDYLCAFDDGFICTVSFVDGDWELWADATEITHWMPLPDAPEVEEES